MRSFIALVVPFLASLATASPLAPAIARRGNALVARGGYGGHSDHGSHGYGKYNPSGSWPRPDWPWHGRNPGSSHPGKCDQSPGHNGWKPAKGGCWTDGVDHVRGLDHFGGNYDTNLTVEICLDRCKDLGFMLAGVEFGQECYCGNTIIGENRPTTSDKCNYPCHGNAKESCGGQDAMNLYVYDNYKFTTGPAEVVYGSKGYKKNPQCWVDSTSARLLPSFPSSLQPTDFMTVEKCLSACSAEGYSAAGLEFGRECYCGNVSFPPPGQSSPAPIDDCSKPCLGDASEYCGGADRILVYTK